MEANVSTKRVRGPELDPSWTLVLRGVQRDAGALTTTGRRFHREGAVISASIGEKRSVKLEEATRAWLLAR